MKTRKFLAFVTSLILVLTMIPLALTVFATENEKEITEISTFDELLNAVNSDKTYISTA